MDVRQGERQCLVPVCGFPTGTRAAETGFLRVVLNRVVGSLFYLEKTDPELVAIRRIVYWKKERERGWFLEAFEGHRMDRVINNFQSFLSFCK